MWKSWESLIGLHQYFLNFADFILYKIDQKWHNFLTTNSVLAEMQLCNTRLKKWLQTSSDPVQVYVIKQ